MLYAPASRPTGYRRPLTSGKYAGFFERAENRAADLVYNVDMSCSPYPIGGVEDPPRGGRIRVSVRGRVKRAIILFYAKRV